MRLSSASDEWPARRASAAVIEATVTGRTSSIASSPIRVRRWPPALTVGRVQRRKARSTSPASMRRRVSRRISTGGSSHGRRAARSYATIESMVRQPTIPLRDRGGRRRELLLGALDDAGRPMWSLHEYEDGWEPVRIERVGGMRLQLMLGLGERRRSARVMMRAEREGVRY